MVSKAVGNRRLLKLAAYIVKRNSRLSASSEVGYYQYEIQHSCGAPACGIGHARALFNKPRMYMQHARDFFALDGEEGMDVFGPFGCDNAGRNWRKAAKYIRAFVKRRQKESA